MNRKHLLVSLTTLVANSLSSLALAQSQAPASSEADQVLPALTVYSPKVANQDSVATFTMPVSALRFDPRVDVQARNLAEGQADVSIRGGIFENTGFKVGGFSLYDPQTGHYLAEIPVSPMLLTAPSVLTGADNAFSGMNANVGTIQYGWRKIRTQGALTLSAAEHQTNSQELYQGYSKSLGDSGSTLGLDVSVARSESAGAIPYGDHYFQRYNGRLQLLSALGQTDLIAAYQGKFFGWPNLYTPFGVKETENLQTVLFGLNHRKDFGKGEYLQVGAFWRRNKDDYEYNRFIPGQYNPYKHTTYVYGFSFDGRNSFGLERFALNSAAQVMFDRIDSTSLTFGPFRHRDFYKLSLVPETWWTLAEGGRLELKAGASFDDTNKDASAVSPLAELTRTWKRNEGLTALSLSFARTTQVASYTAIKSNPNGGLFRGNPNLGRSSSDNLELGATFVLADWKIDTAVFWRQDRDLVDWTYTQGITARYANAVDIDTTGFELSATRSWKHLDLVFGYTALSKNEDYGNAMVDASFYALNFPRHRLTAALVARLGAGLELRFDNEARIQRANFLRTSNSTDYFLSNLGLSWKASCVPGLTVSAQLENLWNSDFEEVPAVPASPRVASLSVAYTW